jgi:putative SOS response-associated peptidase YedK
MCFTVAVVRNNVMMSVQEYYDSLPAYKGKNVELPDFPDFYFVNGFTHPQLPVLTNQGVQLSSWGLIPSWVKDKQTADAIRTKTLNAVGETVFEKPSFRVPVLSQRAILPVTGFYEWRDVQKIKYPYFVQDAHLQGLALGVVYDRWLNPQNASVIESFSIVTTPANPLMETIHNTKKRMPLVLKPEDLYDWLNPSTDTGRINELIKPYPEEMMHAHTISRRVNNTHENHNQPEVWKEVSYPEIESQQNLLF